MELQAYSPFPSLSLLLLLPLFQHCASLKTCAFDKETRLSDEWREEMPVNVICTVTNISVDLGIVPPPNQNGNKFLHITTIDKSESGLYYLRSRPFVFNTSHILKFDYLLRATGETTIKVFADINSEAALMIGFYQIDTNNQWERGIATIFITQPQSKVELEIRISFQNDEDFVAIDNIKIFELLPLQSESSTPTTTLPPSTQTGSSPQPVSTNWTSLMKEAIVPHPASSQPRHSYSTLLIIICICLSILGSTLGMTLLLRRCYVNKEEFSTSSQSSFSN